MAVIHTAQDAADFLLALVRDDPRPYATRAADPQGSVRRLLARLGDPHKNLKVIIHIAGSKGKGSVALLIEAILQAAGLRTGVFTSPHLERWNERFRIDGQSIEDDRFSALMESVRPDVEAMQAQDWDHAPSFFDTATAAAFLLFQQEQVDVAVVETGLGGRLDATNVVDPAVCCITSIELEHTDKLGTSLAQIAAHKAGIIKPGKPVVVGALAEPAMTVVREQAQQANATVLRLGKDFAYAIDTAADHVIRYSSPDFDLSLHSPLLGSHNALNIALAISCVKQLKALDTETLRSAITSGLSQLQLAGRCEVLRRQPWVIVDGAHTLASATALRKVLDELPTTSKRYWVLSFAVGKNPNAIAEVLLQEGDEVIVTQADPQRSQSPDKIAKALAELERIVDIRVEPDPSKAVKQAYARLDADALLCITGSVYMAGVGRKALKP